MQNTYAVYHLFLVTKFSRVRRQLRGERTVLRVPVNRPTTISPVYASTFGVSATNINQGLNNQVLATKSTWPLSLPTLTITFEKWKWPAGSDIKLPSIFTHMGRTAQLWLLNGVIAAAIMVGTFVYLPQIYYSLTPPDTEPVVALATSPEVSQVAETGEPTPTPWPLPPKDETLPEGEWIIIPRIGVRTQLQSTQNPDEALNTGVWLAPDYGKPGSTDQPMIVAAHRYGWQWWWKSDYWKYHSFYLLPDLQPGDIVEAISDQRKYYYEIYAGEEGDMITDYTADMILYTCKFLNSPVRHFRYARLVDMNEKTKVSLVAE